MGTHQEVLRAQWRSRHQLASNCRTAFSKCWIIYWSFWNSNNRSQRCFGERRNAVILWGSLGGGLHPWNTPVYLGFAWQWWFSFLAWPFYQGFTKDSHDTLTVAKIWRSFPNPWGHFEILSRIRRWNCSCCWRAPSSKCWAWFTDGYCLVVEQPSSQC